MPQGKRIAKNFRRNPAGNQSGSVPDVDIHDSNMLWIIDISPTVSDLKHHQSRVTDNPSFLMSSSLRLFDRTFYISQVKKLESM
jgi:hypothetical protein